MLTVQYQRMIFGGQDLEVRILPPGSQEYEADPRQGFLETKIMNYSERKEAPHLLEILDEKTRR